MPVVVRGGLCTIGCESTYGGFSPESSNAMIEGGRRRREAALDLFG